MIAAQPDRPYWGGAYAAKWVRLTLATFRHGLSLVWPTGSEQRRSHDPAIARRPGFAGQPSPCPSRQSAVQLQPPARGYASRTVVRETPAGATPIRGLVTQ